MPVPYHLISRRNITLEEFNGFLQRCNGILDQGLSFSGRISDGEKHVWISLANEELKSYAPDEQRQLFELLRGQPEICILLDVSRTSGSEFLAINFACIIAAESGPVILDDLNGHFLTDKDLYELRNRRLGFPRC